MNKDISLFGAEFNTPPHLTIRAVKSMDDLLAEFGKRAFGYARQALFGVAFLQGGRLQFTSALPIGKLMEMAYVDQAMKPTTNDPARGTAGHVSATMNRPKIPAHANRLRAYLSETACFGEKFFLPSFTLNFGAMIDKDSEVRAELLVVTFASPGGGNGWFAVPSLPLQLRLPTTDGGHRYSQLGEIIGSSKVSDAMKEALRRNSVDIKIVFEDDIIDAHQDFADAGKAQPIAKSQIATYDLRDERNQIARNLTANIGFLRIYIDATAASQNVSSKSPKVWAMSAVRMFVDQVVRQYQDKVKAEQARLKAAGLPVEKEEADPEFVKRIMRGAEHFFKALIENVPLLAVLEKARGNPGDHIETPATVRDLGGGDVVMKAAFLAIAARAYFVADEEGITYAEITKALGSIPWQIFANGKAAFDEDIKNNPGQPYGTVLTRNLRPHLAPLVIIASDRYRITPAVKDIEIAWADYLRPMIDAFLNGTPVDAGTPDETAAEIAAAKAAKAASVLAQAAE